MSTKLTGKTSIILFGVAGLIMIIGIGLGEHSIANKLIIIGLIVAFIFSRFEINRLKRTIQSLENKK